MALTLSTFAALLATNTNSVPDGIEVSIVSPPLLYRFDRASVLTPTTRQIVQPTTGPGRWILQATPIPVFEEYDPLNGTPGLNAPGDVLVASNPQSMFRAPTYLVNDGTYNWVANQSEPFLLRHKVSDNSVVSISLDKYIPTATTVRRNGTYDLDHDATHVFVGTIADDGTTEKYVLIISKATLEVVGICEIPAGAFQAVGITIGTGGDSDKLFVGVLDANPTSILRFSKAAALTAFPATVAPTASLAHPTAGYFQGIIFSSGFLYAGAQDGVYKITSALVVSDSYTPGALSIIDVLPAFGSIWAIGTDFPGANNLFRFTPAAIGGGPTASLVLPFNSGAFNNIGLALTADGSTIWTTNETDYTVNRVSTGVGTEAVIATVTSPSQNDYLTGLVYDGTNMVVAVQGSPFGGPGVNGAGGLTDADAMGLRKISTGLGTEAFTGSLFVGTPAPLSEWRPRHATGRYLVGPISYTVENDESQFVCDTSGGAVTIFIPDVPKLGREITVKDKSPGNASVNNITISSTDLDIEQFAGVDAPNLVLNVDKIAVTLRASGYPNAGSGNWSIV